MHEQWSARRHGCVISDIKFIMKTFLLELEPVWLALLLYINLLVNAICIKPFSNICDVYNFCVLMSRTGYFLLTHPVYKLVWTNLVFKLQALHVVHIAITVEQVTLQGMARLLKHNPQHRNASIILLHQKRLTTHTIQYTRHIYKHKS